MACLYSSDSILSHYIILCLKENQHVYRNVERSYLSLTLREVGPSVLNTLHRIPSPVKYGSLIVTNSMQWIFSPQQILVPLKPVDLSIYPPLLSRYNGKSGLTFLGLENFREPLNFSTFHLCELKVMWLRTNRVIFCGTMN